MFLDIVILIASLALILGGANYLTDGASSVARRWGVSTLVIGLTIVSIGSSAPEFVISVTSAAHHSGGLAIGDIVGSNIFNILVIVGVVAIIRPLKVQKGTLANELPLVVLSTIVLIICSVDKQIDGFAVDEITRSDGLLMILFFLIFLRYTFAIAHNLENTGEPVKIKVYPLWLSLVMIIGGLAALVWGGNLFVNSASDIARICGVSEAVIGLTIVAVGTSLPELATSITAAIKNEPGLAIGTVVGSAVFNVFLILGVSATLWPLTMGGITLLDFGVLLLASILFWAFGQWFKVRTITRPEGIIMVLCYIAYTIVLIHKAVH